MCIRKICEHDASSETPPATVNVGETHPQVVIVPRVTSQNPESKLLALIFPVRSPQHDWYRSPKEGLCVLEIEPSAPDLGRVVLIENKRHSGCEILSNNTNLNC